MNAHRTADRATSPLPHVEPLTQITEQPGVPLGLDAARAALNAAAVAASPQLAAALLETAADNLHWALQETISREPSAQRESVLSEIRACAIQTGVALEGGSR